jgi:CRP-like cAMP-binding protein
MNAPLPVGDDLKTIPLLSGLTEEGLQQVLGAMVTRDFGPGEVILRQDIITQNVWLLLDGRCEVTKDPPLGELGKTVRLAEIGPYETFGEMTVFVERPATASVSALTDVKTIKLRRADFDRLTEEHPATACRVACNLVNILSDRLRRMDEWITDLLDERETVEMREQWAELRDRLQQTFRSQIF